MFYLLLILTVALSGLFCFNARFRENILDHITRHRVVYGILLAVVLVFSFFFGLPAILDLLPAGLKLLMQILFALVFVGIQIFAMFYFMSRARVYWIMPGESDTTFDDYRGNPEVLQRAREVVRVMKAGSTPQAVKMGLKPVRGVLLEGPPGTGKSYLARAISGEAGVPFAYCSSPSLESAFMGMSAMTVWRLYGKAKKYADRYGGCILFFDEIDAVGRARGGQQQGSSMMGGFMGGGGGSQILNELLTQMDPPPTTRGTSQKLGNMFRRMVGIRPRFATRANVLTIGATNLVSTLDSALLRPGRFDRHITVNLPDVNGRREIIDYYLGKVQHTLEPADVDKFVLETGGSSPIAIQHIVNEALIHASEEGRDHASFADIEKAIETYEWSIANMEKNRGFGQSQARDAKVAKDDIEKITFNDVAGCDEAVKELRRVVKGLIGKDVYAQFGAQMPSGILLIGPPGTGKTLLAKAVAGELDGSVDITSGSAFVEMFVGVGASRTRDMFARARTKVAATGKPHVIFIDEIDGMGGKRGSGAMGGNGERDHALNQLLVELDGVVGNKGIIIIAATNRVDMLDEALLRPGRFDCHVNVDLPDQKGREAIFAIHLRNKAAIAGDVSLAKLAQRSYTYSGAEIKSACDRAAIIAAERYYSRCEELASSGSTPEEISAKVVAEINMNDFDEALDFVRYGDAKPTKQKAMTEEEKKNTAWHEAGHAISAAIFKESDQVMKITILRRSKALGYVQFMPEVDRVSFNREQCLARIVVAMAGRAAQEIYLDTCDSGASSDFQQATELAKQMVTSWGMTKVGHLALSSSKPVFGNGSATFGDELGNKVDVEINRIVESCYEAAKKIVSADKERMEELVKVLMEKETVLTDEWVNLLERIASKITVEELALPYWKGKH